MAKEGAKASAVAQNFKLNLAKKNGATRTAKIGPPWNVKPPRQKVIKLNQEPWLKNLKFSKINNILEPITPKITMIIPKFMRLLGLISRILADLFSNIKAPIIPNDIKRP
jgi:hypothetical protein